MFLSDPVKLRTELGFEDMGDINSAVAGALDTAETILASILDSDFTFGTRTDTFVGVDPIEILGTTCRTEFRLSTGFARLIKAERILWDGPQDLLPALTLDPTTGGLVKDLTTAYALNRVDLTYTHGFQPAAGDPMSYDLSTVPVWLQQAAHVKAKILMADSPPVTQAEIKIDTKLLDLQFSSLISRRMRYHPMALIPV